MPHPSKILRRYFRHGLFPQMMVFEAVARLGSVTRAAEELHLAQPTASTQIRKLSEALDLKLFEQQGRQLRPTVAGRELLAACNELIAVLARSEGRLAELRTSQSDVLRIAAVPGARHLAARLLAAFCVRYPGVQSTLRLTQRGALPEPGARADEVILVHVPDDRPGLELHPVADELLFLYARAGHRFAKVRRMPLTSLADETVVLREPGSSLRAMVLAALESRGLRPVVRAELTGNDAVAEAVAQGLGIALLPESVAQSFVESGVIARLDVQDFPLRRQWGIGHAKHARLAPCAALFMREALAGELLATGQRAPMTEELRVPAVQLPRLQLSAPAA
ncbi:MAG TPA: LysR family transcriptional regulator [Burkholderiales bacterium]|nr:LysR family transcriptional regulator [Burkholderiales bacterium]